MDPLPKTTAFTTTKGIVTVNVSKQKQLNLSFSSQSTVSAADMLRVLPSPPLSDISRQRGHSVPGRKDKRSSTAEQPSLIATTTSLLPGLSSVSPENSSALSDIEPVDPTDTDDVSKKSKSSSKRVKRCDPVKIRVVRYGKGMTAAERGRQFHIDEGLGAHFGKYFCMLCKTEVDVTRKFSSEQHILTATHKAAKTRLQSGKSSQAKSLLWATSKFSNLLGLPSIPIDEAAIRFNAVSTWMASGIPLNTFDNQDFKEFFHHLGFAIKGRHQMSLYISRGPSTKRLFFLSSTGINWYHSSMHLNTRTLSRRNC